MVFQTLKERKRMTKGRVTMMISGKEVTDHQSQGSYALLTFRSSRTGRGYTNLSRRSKDQKFCDE